MDSNWPRWIKLSVVQAFRTAIGNDLFIYVEGTVDRPSDRNFCELRFDGPFYDEVSKGYWNIDIMIDVLVGTNLDPKDAVVHERNVGSVLAGFNTNIPVMQYGTGPDDNSAIQLGCFRAISKVITTPFGQVKPDTRLMQSTVEQTFRMNLKA